MVAPGNIAYGRQSLQELSTVRINGSFTSPFHSATISEISSTIFMKNLAPSKSGSSPAASTSTARRRSSRSRTIRSKIVEALERVEAHAAARSSSSRCSRRRRKSASFASTPTTLRNCAGLILWMHTFSPSKMWIGGLSALAQAVPPSPHPVQSRPALGRRSTWIS